MRYIAVFLLLLNIVYFGWNQYRSKQQQQAFAPVESRPLLNNGLTLVSEYGPSSNSDPLFSCVLVGDFSSVDEADGFIAQLDSEFVSASLKLSGELLPAQYRVYLSPLSSRAIATITLDGLSESLQAVNLDIEFYLITRGLLENAIGLGVFAELDEASAVRDQVSGLGYAVEVDEIPRSSGNIRVQLQAASPDQIENLKWLELSEDWPYLTRTENVCETIAQATQFP